MNRPAPRWRTEVGGSPSRAANLRAARSVTATFGKARPRAPSALAAGARRIAPAPATRTETRRAMDFFSVSLPRWQPRDTLAPYTAIFMATVGLTGFAAWLGGTWSGPNVTASATDATGNTSELSVVGWGFTGRSVAEYQRAVLSGP